jgi:GT2 family glycosyltransferase
MERPSFLPDVSVALGTRDRPEMLGRAVSSILAGTALPAELVIVDQSDAPHPALRDLRLPRGPAIRHVHSASRGLARARNEAARLAQGRVLVFTDDDVLVDRSWLARLVSALEAAGENVVVTGRVVAGEPEVEGAFAPSLKGGDVARVYRGRVRDDPLVSANMALPRILFERLGGLDPRLGVGTAFPGGEDNDFGFRALESGCAIVYVPDAVVVHRAWRPAADQYLRQRWGYGRGQGAFLAKHLGRDGRFIGRRIAGSVTRVTARALRRLIAPHGSAPQGRWRTAAGELVLAAGIVSGTIAWLAGRHRAS